MLGLIVCVAIYGGTTVSMAQQTAAPPKERTRDQIEAKYKWNLAELYADVEAWEAGFAAAQQKIEKLAGMKGTLGKSADSLLSALKHRDDTIADVDKLVVYAGLAYHLDMSNSETAGRSDRAQSLATRASEAMSWMVPEILTLPSETVESWMKDSAELAVYRHMFADIDRQRKHTLSAREEELLAMTGDVTASFGTIFGRLQNTDLDYPVIKDENGEDLKLTNAKYYQLIYSPDRRVRRDAFLGMHQVYLDKRNSLSAVLSGQVKQHMFYAKARGFNSSLEAALFGPGIPPAVVENLIRTINANLPRLHRYVALRKKIMGLDKVHRYDLYVPLVEGERDKIPYDEATKTILAALEPMGSGYVATMRTAFDSRWIDVYETPNKRSGAYSWGAYNAPHPYLLLNYTGTANDRSTVAHEMGHAMHSWYTCKAQPFVYGDYATFCAEVASTVNEVLLAHYLLQHAADDTERLLILQDQIESIRTTVFRQTMFAEFEKLIHEQAEAGQALTGDGLCALYGELVQRYYGPDLELDEAGKAEGLRIPHYYRNFYVYTYATSHCAATNIGRRIIDGQAGAVEGHVKFLAAGSSRYPLEVLKLAGVDMTTPQPIEDTMDLFDDLVDQFEALYNRRKAGTASP